MAELFEVFMLICFGISWPISVIKSIRSKSAEGKSVVFTCVITVGYICGIISKIAANNVTYVLWLYVINLVIVLVDLVITIINKTRKKNVTAHSVNADIAEKNVNDENNGEEVKRAHSYGAKHIHA